MIFSFTAALGLAIRMTQFSMRRLLFLSSLLMTAAASAKDTPAEIDVPGARTNGFVQLPNQWLLHPAGKQLVVGDFPVNIAVHPDGKYAAVLHSGNGQNEVVIFDEMPLSTNWLIVQTNYVKETNAEPAKSRSSDEAAILKRAEAALDPIKGNEPFPFTCVLDEWNRRLYVSLWGQAQVAVIDTRRGRITGRWAVQEHPNEMLLAHSGKLLYVANANRNSVTVLNTETGETIETLLAELLPQSLPGSTPNSLALSHDEKTLYVANANINALALFDVSQPGKSRSLGFIPTGWYP